MKIIRRSYFLLLFIVTLLPLSAQDSELVPAEPVAQKPDQMIDRLVFRDDSAIALIELLEELTGKIVLRRQDMPITKINFDSRGPISQRETILALESLLSLSGVMLTDMGGRFMKAAPATDVNSHVPDMLIGSTLDLAPSQQIYAKLFKLDYLDAEQANGTIIQNLMSKTSSVVPFVKSNALLVTDSLINLQRIENILKDADRPQTVREEIKFVKLAYIQANEMQDRLENLIKGPLKNYLEGNTSVTADERTNQLILITHPGNLSAIMDVINSVDVDAAPLTGSEVFALRQAKAIEVVPIIDDIITGQKQGREEDAKVARENESAANNNAQTPAVPGAAPNAPAAPTPTVSVSVESNSSLQFSNFVGLAADERTNSIVAYGTQQDLKTLGELIDKIDIPLPQVLIEAIITQVTLNEKQTSGLNEIGFNYDNAIRTFSDITLGTAGGITISNGVLNLDDPDSFSLSTDIEPLNSDSDTRVLSTPRIVVSHNEEGIINVSRSQPIITSSTSSLENPNNNTRSTVEYRDIGIQLTVTPLIGADGTVQMVIEQKIENVIDNVEIDGNFQPVIGKREATSTIGVKDGQIIILAGLQENTITEGNSYMPIIGRLPLIRNIFGGSTEDFDRTEILIFIRPKVLLTPESADSLAMDQLNKAAENEVVNEYLENNTTGDVYLEGSKFEEKEQGRKDPNPLIQINWP